MIDYSKIDALVANYFRAANRAAFLANLYGDLTAAEARQLMQGIEDGERDELAVAGSCK